MKQQSRKYKNFVSPVAPPRILAVGWQMANQPLVIVTDEDVESIFSSVHQTELDMMAADLEALRAEVRPVKRLTKAQMDEIEADRPEQPGVAEIAPYISF